MRCFGFTVFLSYCSVATEWQCMLQFFKGNQMKLIAVFSVIAITMHEMKEEGIQMEDLIPNCSEKNMEDDVFLSLYLPQQINTNELSLHLER